MNNTALKKLVVPTLGILTMMSSTYSMEAPDPAEAAKANLNARIAPILKNEQLLFTQAKSNGSTKKAFDEILQQLATGDIFTRTNALVKLGKMTLKKTNSESEPWPDEQTLLTTLNGINKSKSTNIKDATVALANSILEDETYNALKYKPIILTLEHDETGPEAPFVVGEKEAEYLKGPDGKITQAEKKKISNLYDDYTKIPLLKEANKIGLTNDELHTLISAELTNDKADIEKEIEAINSKNELKKIYAQKLRAHEIEIEEKDIDKLTPHITRTVEENWASEDKNIKSKYDLVDITTTDTNKYKQIITYIDAKIKTKITPKIKKKRKGEEVHLFKLYDESEIITSLNTIIQKEKAKEDKMRELLEDYNTANPDETIDWTTPLGVMDTLVANYNNIMTTEGGSKELLKATEETIEKYKKQINDLTQQLTNERAKLKSTTESLNKQIKELQGKALKHGDGNTDEIIAQINEIAKTYSKEVSINPAKTAAIEEFARRLTTKLNP